MTDTRITPAELNAKLSDLSIPEKDLARYFLIDEEGSGLFNPRRQAEAAERGGQQHARAGGGEQPWRRLRRQRLGDPRRQRAVECSAQCAGHCGTECNGEHERGQRRGAAVQRSRRVGQRLRRGVVGGRHVAAAAVGVSKRVDGDRPNPVVGRRAGVLEPMATPGGQRCRAGEPPMHGSAYRAPVALRPESRAAPRGRPPPARTAQVASMS